MKVVIVLLLFSMGVMITDMSCKSSEKIKKSPTVYEVLAVNESCCKIYLQQGLHIETIQDSLRWRNKSKGDTVILWRVK